MSFHKIQSYQQRVKEILIRKELLMLNERNITRKLTHGAPVTFQVIF